MRGVLVPHRASLGGAGIATRCDIDGANRVRRSGAAHPARGQSLQNTCRYTDPPGILRVSLRRKATTDLPLADSAPGVRDEELPWLTDRRFRVERATAALGAGFGLAVAKLIVDAHEGSMEANTVTRGSGGTSCCRAPPTRVKSRNRPASPRGACPLSSESRNRRASAHPCPDAIGSELRRDHEHALRRDASLSREPPDRFRPALASARSDRRRRHSSRAAATPCRRRFLAKPMALRGLSGSFVSS